MELLEAWQCIGYVFVRVTEIYRDVRKTCFLRRVFCCFKTYFLFFLWPLLSILTHILTV